jgi:two-component sensor histidine kinase
MEGIKAVVVLDADLRPLGANREFHRVFGIAPQTLEATVSRILESLGSGPQDIRRRVEHMVAQDDMFENMYWPDVSGNMRSLVLMPAYGSMAGQRAFLFIEDITQQRHVEQQLVDRLEQDELMLEEMRHRMANSLQIVASVLRIKSHLVRSAEGRRHLEDVHERVLSIAELQEQLDAAREGKVGSISDYLSAVCARLTDSLMDPKKAIQLRVEAADIQVGPEVFISIGLVVSELVINALKHGFPGRSRGLIRVTFAGRGRGWILSVMDDGVGCDSEAVTARPGMGSRIIRALARRLKAQVRVAATDPHGLTVTLTHHAVEAKPS